MFTNLHTNREKSQLPATAREVGYCEGTTADQIESSTVRKAEVEGTTRWVGYSEGATTGQREWACEEATTTADRVAATKGHTREQRPGG